METIIKIYQATEFQHMLWVMLIVGGVTIYSSDYTQDKPKLDFIRKLLLAPIIISFIGGLLFIVPYSIGSFPQFWKIAGFISIILLGIFINGRWGTFKSILYFTSIILMVIAI